MGTVAFSWQQQPLTDLDPALDRRYASLINRIRDHRQGGDSTGSPAQANLQVMLPRRFKVELPRRFKVELPRRFKVELPRL